MKFTSRMSIEEQERRLHSTFRTPVQNFFGIRIVSREPGYSTLEMVASENTMNLPENFEAGRVHGGVMYAMLDVAAYVALLPLMNDDQNAYTHDINVNLMKPVKFGKTVIFKGIIRRVGRTIAFCDSEAWCDGELVATGRVTKSIVAYVKESSTGR